MRPRRVAPATIIDVGLVYAVKSLPTSCALLVTVSDPSSTPCLTYEIWISWMRCGEPRSRRMGAIVGEYV